MLNGKRDHLLALSVRGHPDEWTGQTRYVLLYPSRNVRFRHAADALSKILIDGDTSFQFFTIDDLLEAAFGHDAESRDAIRGRYLWWIDIE